MQPTLAIFSMPGPFEWMIIAGVALMIFGKRLPSVGKDLALGIRGFQQGLKDDGSADPKSLPNRE
jgi:sec-independent protein translocase protein TatA